MRWQWKNRRLSDGSASEKKGGGGCLILFGLVFAGMGLLFFTFLARQFLAEAETYRWIETPCEITRCEIEVKGEHDDNPFQLVVSYRYLHEGRHRTSDRYTLQPERSDDYEKLALIRRELTRDAELVCYVNPGAPEEAVIVRKALATGLFMLFPLIFVAVGAGIVWGGIVTLRSRGAKDGATGKKTAISADGASGKKSGWIVGVIVGAVFFVIGLAVAWPLGINPIKRMLSSRGWVETPCEILWSRVRSHDSDDGTTYSVDIFYEYEFGGERHRSNRYAAMGGSSSGRAGKMEVVRQYPVGSRQVCFVNPDLPEQAMLKPGFSAWAFAGLLPLVFSGVGLAVLLASLNSRRGKGTGHVVERPMTGADGEEGSIVLRPHAGRWLKMLGMLALALFWNGIVSVFVVEMVKGWQAGRGDIFLTIFMIPFLLVGCAILWGFFYQLLAMANPRPVITLVNGAPRLGDELTLTWELSGRAARVVAFRISLWGVESATYRRGTDTVTATEVFFDRVIFETSSIDEMRSGTATVRIPEDLMYSLKLDNNEIKYELRVKGDIPLWPDIGDHFDLTLLPRRPNPV